MSVTITNDNIQWGPVSLFQFKSADGALADIGATVEGVTVFYSREMMEVTCAERFTPILVFRGTERAEVRLRMREHSMRNFAIAAGLDPDDTTNGVLRSDLAQDRDNVIVGGLDGVAEEYSGKIQRINRQDGATLAAFDQLEFYRGVVIPNYETKYAQDYTEHDITMLLLPEATVTITVGVTATGYTNVLFNIYREIE